MRAKGWKLHHDEALGTGRNLLWKDASAKRADNTFPQLQFIVLDLTQEQVNDFGRNLKSVANKRVDGEVYGLEEISRTAPEGGYINGRFAVRQRWSARHSQSGRVAHGAVYVLLDNLQLVVMLTGLTEPGHAEAIGLAEASFLTLKRSN